MRDIIYNILVKYYGRMNGYSFCDTLTEYLADAINNREVITRGDVMNYIWMNTSGGGVAEMSSDEIQKALPNVIQDTYRRSYKGEVR